MKVNLPSKVPDHNKNLEEVLTLLLHPKKKKKTFCLEFLFKTLPSNLNIIKMDLCLKLEFYFQATYTSFSICWTKQILQLFTSTKLY